MKTTTNAPWNEKSTNFSFQHCWNHLWYGLKKNFFFNRPLLVLVLLYIMGLVILYMSSLIDIVYLLAGVLPIIAILLAVNLRETLYQMKVESLQNWLYQAYNIKVDYLDALLILTAFYHGASQYVIPNISGGVVRSENGLIFLKNP